MQKNTQDITLLITMAAVFAACGDSLAINDGFPAASMSAPGSYGSSDDDTGIPPTSGDQETGAYATSGTDSASAGESATPAVCGDGLVEGEEGCDDGPSNAPGAACRPGCVVNVCGDGDLSPAEACDDGIENGPNGACSAVCGINPSACGTIVATPTIKKEPLDVIFVIDNSGSMSQEIKGVQDNINKNFAAILEAAGLDYSVVVVSRFGSYVENKICVEAPLGAIPGGGCSVPPKNPGSTARFHHYSTFINSTNAWCQILATGIGVKDDFGMYGWMKYLREDAFKAFVVVSDDAADCTFESLPLYDNQYEANNLKIAHKFDDALRTMEPSEFGALDGERRYTVHSLVGLAAAPDGQPYGPTDPTILATCPSANEPGAGHQVLSKLTGGLRFPVCDPGGYDKVFQALADSVISGAKIACDFSIPDAPEGENLDLASVGVRYHAMGDPNSYESIMAVPDATGCGSGGFFIDGTTIHLCPSTCEEIQADDTAQIDVEFKCLPVIPG